MSLYNNDLLQRHISTHSQPADEDKQAVSTLETFLNSGGRINTNFNWGDKWPNHDGTFEFVSNPEISRCPEQNFIVQIKGTCREDGDDDTISYSLKSLAFPAFIAADVTADPGILFLIVNPTERGRQRVFWKYLSPSFINKIDFTKSSTTIKFGLEDEIKYTDESIDNFCSKIQEIAQHHLFLNRLNKDNLQIEDAKKIILARSEDISEEIDRINEADRSRDKMSRKIINSLYDLCYAVLIMNAVKLGCNEVDERLAWELAQFSIETKYLSDFLKGLKYINSKIPDAGQAERLMLKYYNYLWEIRKFLKDKFNMEVLQNLENFPKNTDNLDNEYYEMVATSIEETDLTPLNPRISRYYIQKKIPFFVKGERYFEITLQLAEMYATKFNRVTVYTKENISSKYSIQIAYTEAEITLWGVNNKIKVVTNWKVSIDPFCLNKLGNILKIDSRLSTNYGEYDALMEYLTITGMNLLELINLHPKRFQEAISQIYDRTNTHIFKDILLKLRKDYSIHSNKKGKYTVRYILLNLREELLNAVLPNSYDKKCLTEELNITSRCFPFENQPFLSNLAGKKTSRGNINDLLDITDDLKKFNIVHPYLQMEKLIYQSGELYFNAAEIANSEEIKRYNESLDSWERNNGFLINERDGIVSIDSYENTTLYILEKILRFSKIRDKGQKRVNAQYLAQGNINFTDELKRNALKNAFVDSQIMLIYGAAGTGKTMLVNYISNMMSRAKKLFLTKTHTALQNLKRRIESPGTDSEFMCIDSFKKQGSLAKYDIVFVDECSTIDNRTMKMFLERIDEGTILVLAGDIYQIESIEFGNWFYYAKQIINTKGANIELFNTWRTNKEELKSLWDTVRKKETIITEKLVIDGPFSANIGEDIFIREDEDEIVLCLNYDGKFGLNNVNLYFQNVNTQSEAYSWEEWTFKVGDPVIFLDTKRSPLLYNNLKGRIVDILKSESSIIFTLDIQTSLTERECRNESFEFIDTIDSGTRICLEVLAKDDEAISEENRFMSIIPFQLAYAASIHKAQGLEYNSVKIIIPSSNSDKITHSIFYTAITRAKEKLKIYWSAETMESIVASFTEEKIEQKTLPIIKEKLQLIE